MSALQKEPRDTADGQARVSRFEAEYNLPPPLLLAKPPSVLWVWGGKEQKGEERKGHFQLNRIKEGNKAKMKKEKTKREG